MRLWRQQVLPSWWGWPCGRDCGCAESTDGVAKRQPRDEVGVWLGWGRVGQGWVGLGRWCHFINPSTIAVRRTKATTTLAPPRCPAHDPLRPSGLGCLQDESCPHDNASTHKNKKIKTEETPKSTHVLLHTSHTCFPIDWVLV